MDGFAYADIIFFALLAGYILNRLRTTLGQDDGNRIQPGNLFNGPKAKKTDKKHKESFAEIVEQKVVPISEDVKIIEDTKLDDKALQKKIDSIKAKSPDFTLANFFAGAQMAFEMVMNAYAKGDRDTLKGLLAKDIYTDFDKEITKREKSQKIVESTLVEASSADIVDISINKNKVSITVDFVTEQVTVVKDKDGEVIEGNASAAETVEDSWVFEKNITSSNPNWTITSL